MEGVAFLEGTFLRGNASFPYESRTRCQAEPEIEKPDANAAPGFTRKVAMIC